MSRILVVDDEASIRGLMQEVLGSNGYKCDAVGSAHEALDRISKAAYDLVIIDENMPLMTGSQAVDLLRSNPKYKGLPILMCTSHAVDQAVQADEFIEKPIDLQKLLAAAKRMTARA